MKRKKLIILIFCFVLLFCSCQNSFENEERESSNYVNTSMEEDMLFGYEEIIEETSEYDVKYEKLSEENFEEVITILMSISDEDDLRKLDCLPLTRELYDELRNDFSYIIENDDLKWLRIDAWGINEDRFGCIFYIKTQKEEVRDYYIEMELDEGIVKDIELILLSVSE